MLKHFHELIDFIDFYITLMFTLLHFINEELLSLLLLF